MENLGNVFPLQQVIFVDNKNNGSYKKKNAFFFYRYKI